MVHWGWLIVAFVGGILYSLYYDRVMKSAARKMKQDIFKVISGAKFRSEL